ncbi:hypothetical protein QVD17_16246 [Tagetes erecta]|uniref:Uncharacterized protein n=1 Tax=Tagetes erecta TaxID=13708 RepID=A0AAD8KRC5_TARER|nr:hypothetical protein QVD17_16246 [Tagetes erecta]
MHSKNGAIDNPKAQEHWEKIQEEHTRLQNEVGDLSSVDEVVCLKRALGERPGHIRGVGKKLKRISIDVASAYNQQIQKEVEQQVQQQLLPFQEQFKAMQQIIEQLQTRNKCNRRDNDESEDDSLA